MELRRPKFDGTIFWTALFLVGLSTEVAVWIVAQYWADRFSADSIAMGPVVFLVALGCIYVSSQVLNLLFAIDTVAGLSLSLLAAMLAWLAALCLLLVLSFFAILAVYSLVGVPVRIVAYGVSALRDAGLERRSSL